MSGSQRSVAIQGTLFLAVCFILIVLYGRVIHTPYFFDDLQAFGGDLNNVALPSLQSLWFPQSRPLLQTWFWFVSQWGDSAVVAYRVSGLIIHFVNGFLVFQLVRMLGAASRNQWVSTEHRLHRQMSSEWIGISVAVIWLMHPVVAQTVCSIVQQAESIVTMFLILYLIAIVRLQAWARWKTAILLQVILCCGLYTKFVMVAALPAGLLLDAILQQKSIARTLRTSWMFHVPPLVVAAIAVLQFVPSLLRSEGGVGFGGEAPPILVYLMTSVRSLVGYVCLTFFPISLSVDRSPRWIVNVQESLPWVMLSGAYLTVSVWLWWRSTQVNNSLGRFIAWLLLMPVILLLPTSSFVPTADPFFEHRIYFAMVFWIWIVLLLGDWVRTRFAVKEQSRRFIVAGAMLTIGGVLLLRTHFRLRDYESPQSIWKSALLVDADNTRAAQNFVAAMQSAGLDDAVEGSLMDVAESAQDRGRAFNATVHQLGRLSLKRGETESSLRVFRQLCNSSRRIEDCITSRQRREFGELWFDSAIAHLQNQDPQSAMISMQKVLQATPNDPIAKQLASEIQLQLESNTSVD